VMPLDRMPSISLGIFVPVGAVYDTDHHWRTDTVSPGRRLGSTPVAIATLTFRPHRPPCVSWPPPCWTPPTGPTRRPWRLLRWRGWRADVGRQP
jgi:hypothetical protein